MCINIRCALKLNTLNVIFPKNGTDVLLICPNTLVLTQYQSLPSPIIQSFNVLVPASQVLTKTTGSSIGFKMVCHDPIAPKLTNQIGYMGNGPFTDQIVCEGLFNLSVYQKNPLAWSSLADKMQQQYWSKWEDVV